ncbi:MAG: transcriptional regulator [Spirochaetales bacterium]|nr:MAG: transcriptional regulator [Spirochaetales bacterium]
MSDGQVVNNVKHFRALASLTQEDLARLVKVTRQTIIAIERGNYTPSVLLALRLSKALGCSVEDIFNEKPS